MSNNHKRYIKTAKSLMKFVAATVGIFLVFTVAFASADLDSTFGNGGKVFIHFGDVGQADFANAIVIQPDGKIVAVGRTYQSSQGTNTSNFVIVRLETNGNADFSFGFFGTRNTDFDGNRDEANAVALQPDGKIVVGGFRDTNISTRFSFALARYTSNGNLDTTFGTNGKVVTDFAERGAKVSKILILPNGKIVAVGTNQGNDLINRVVMAVYNANGTLDSSFGTNGKMTLGFGGESYLGDATLQSDGKILISMGAIACNGANCDTLIPILTRFNSSLSLDRKFGRRHGKEYGVAGTEFGNQNSNATVLIDSTGNIIAGGNQLARYSATGNFISLLTPVGFPVFALAQKADGKFVACGNITQTATLDDIRLALLDSNGNNIGNGITDVFGKDDACRAIAVQSDGKILVVGSTKVDETGNFYDFLILRYNNITP